MPRTGTIDATIQQTQPLTVAYQKLHGGYEQIPKGFERLYGWLGPRGHQSMGRPMACFTTGSGPDADLEAWAPIEDGATQFGPDESGLGIKQVDEMEVAVTRYTGPYDRIGEVHEPLAQWATEHGYEPAGPPIEVYVSDPATTGPEDYTTEVLLPVRER